MGLGRLTYGVRSTATYVRCAALSLGGLLLLAGCRGGGVWQQVPPPEVILSTAQPVWERLTARRLALQSLKGLAHVRLDTGSQRFTLDDTVVVLRRYEAIRLEGIGPFGQPLFLFIADGSQFSLYAPQEQELITGLASAENLRRLFGITLAPRALQDVLLGDVPLATPPATEYFAYLEQDNLYEWQGREQQESRRYRIWFEPYHLQPVRFEVRTTAGEVLIEVRYDDFHQLGSWQLPYRIAIDTFEQSLVTRRVIWHYSDVQLNEDVAPALFRMHLPAGIKRVELE